MRNISKISIALIFTLTGAFFCLDLPYASAECYTLRPPMIGNRLSKSFLDKLRKEKKEEDPLKTKYLKRTKGEEPTDYIKRVCGSESLYNLFRQLSKYNNRYSKGNIEALGWYFKTFDRFDRHLQLLCYYIYNSPDIEESARGNIIELINGPLDIMRKKIYIIKRHPGLNGEFRERSFFLATLANRLRGNLTSLAWMEWLPEDIDDPAYFAELCKVNLDSYVSEELKPITNKAGFNAIPKTPLVMIRKLRSSYDQYITPDEDTTRIFYNILKEEERIVVRILYKAPDGEILLLKKYRLNLIPLYEYGKRRIGTWEYIEDTDIIGRMPNSTPLYVKIIEDTKGLDLYKILGVELEDGPETIKKRYLELVKIFHPDKGIHPSGERFKRITAAYEILKNPQKRAIYHKNMQKRIKLKMIKRLNAYLDLPGTFNDRCYYDQKLGKRVVTASPNEIADEISTYGDPVPAMIIPFMINRLNKMMKAKGLNQFVLQKPNLALLEASLESSSYLSYKTTGSALLRIPLSSERIKEFIESTFINTQIKKLSFDGDDLLWTDEILRSAENEKKAEDSIRDIRRVLTELLEFVYTDESLRAGSGKILKAIEVLFDEEGKKLRAEIKLYPIHPLQVAVNLIRDFGITEPDLIVSAILHDIIEDVEKYGKNPDLIGRMFGKKVQRNILAVSNKELSDDEKDFLRGFFIEKLQLDAGSPETAKSLDAIMEILEYQIGVSRETRKDPAILILKSADLSDNALSQKNLADNPRAQSRLSSRYKGLLISFSEKLEALAQAESSKEKEKRNDTLIKGLGLNAKLYRTSYAELDGYSKKWEHAELHKKVLAEIDVRFGGLETLVGNLDRLASAKNQPFSVGEILERISIDSRTGI